VIRAKLTDTYPCPEGRGDFRSLGRVIVIIGVNRTFDHIFATYKPVLRDDLFSDPKYYRLVALHRFVEWQEIGTVCSALSTR
jgi:hypothetical protein